MSFIDILKELTNPESIIKYGGLVLLLAIVFAENGLIIGFFLPGDSLIFLSGLICATQPHLLDTSIAQLITFMALAAIGGSLAGYVFGLKVGPPIFERKDSVIFKKKYLELTRSFYEKHGGKTLVLGRFLPIIRTFAPILAGAIKVDFKVFMFFNCIGGILWTSSLGLIGYFLGDQFPQVKDYVGHIVIGLVLVTSTIIIRTYLKEKQNLKNNSANL